MKSSDALLDAWNATLALQRDRAAIFATSGKVERTFAEIEDGAQSLVPDLERFGPGQVLAIQIGNHPDWPALLLACLRRRIVVLPLEASMSESDRNAALKVCGAAGIAAARRGGANYEIKSFAMSSRLLPDSAVLLKLTSGTTAAPRAIRFRSAQLLADCAQICDTMGITERDVNFAVVPVSHSYGFSNLITPLLARGVPMVLSRDRTPRAVLDDLVRTGATVFPGMPVFYQAFVEMSDATPFPKLRLCISAGAPLTSELARKFYEKFGQSIHSFYGASECGGICYDAENTAVESGFVGTPMRGVELEFLEANADSSRVRVRSAAVAAGYFPEPDAEKLGVGVFIPDDLLTRGKGGLRIVGRTSDVINVAGKKVSPAEVEAELLRFPGVEEAVVFGRPSSLRHEEVAACVVTSAKVSENELLVFCRQKLSGWQVPKRIFFLREIPVNERGKTSRRDLARLFAPQAS